MHGVRIKEEYGEEFEVRGVVPISGISKDARHGLQLNTGPRM